MAAWLGAWLVAGCASDPNVPRDPEGRVDTLGRAWQFACAITNDVKDRAACQERVALAYLASDRIREALTCARSIETWRGAVALADIAAWEAERGESAAAETLVAEAALLNASVRGWPHDRVRMHIAQARMQLHQDAVLQQEFEHYLGNREVHGRVGAYHALATARRGDVQGAVTLLEHLPEPEFYDVAVWRAQGYLMIARDLKLTAISGTNMVDRVWDAVAKIPDYRRFELQLDVVDLLLERNEPADARRRMERITESVEALGLPGHITVPLMAEVALRWARLGDAARLTGLHAAAEPLMRSDMQSIERPPVQARFAEGYAAAGEISKAEALFCRAIDETVALANLRPRAMCAVEIALALHRAELCSDAVTRDLTRLEGSFHAVD